MVSAGHSHLVLQPRGWRLNVHHEEDEHAVEMLETLEEGQVRGRMASMASGGRHGCHCVDEGLFASPELAEYGDINE